MIVVIATCTKGVIRIEHELAMIAQAWPLGHGRGFSAPRGFGIQDARNVAVKDAEAQGADALLFYDDDMIPTTPNALMKLITAMDQRPEIDVIAGVYPRRTYVPEPVCEKEPSMGAFWGWEDGEIHQCWMVGTGFTLYRMSAFDKMDVPTDLIKPVEYDEAVECRRIFEIGTGTDDFHFAIEAEKVGIKQYVHGGVIAHQIGLDGETWKVEDARVRLSQAV